MILSPASAASRRAVVNRSCGFAIFSFISIYMPLSLDCAGRRATQGGIAARRENWPHRALYMSPACPATEALFTIGQQRSVICKVQVEADLGGLVVLAKIVGVFAADLGPHVINAAAAIRS